MTMAAHAHAIAAKEAFFDLVEFDPGPLSHEMETVMSALYERERQAVVSIAETPTQSLDELAKAAALLAFLVDDGGWPNEQPLLAKRVADDLARLAGQTNAHHS